MSQIALKAAQYLPSTALTGNTSSVIYRGAGMKMRGFTENSLFFEAYAGSLNLAENYTPVACTGTLAFSPSSTTVTGTGTVFLTELHLGQLIIANAEVLSVQRIISQTSFIANRLPTTTETTATAYRLPVLFPLNINRGVQLTGNATIWDKGTILSVGSGVLYMNGTVLPGASLTAKRQAQVALYDSSTNTYAIQDIGFSTTPTAPTVTVVGSGGTKNMSLGYYSFKVAYYSVKTTGYGNPTATILSAGAGFQVTVANSTFNFDFTADTPPTHATGYIIYASAFTNDSTQSAINAIQGGWFEVRRVPFTSLTSHAIAFDYTDADLGSLVSFNNDVPPDAEFYTSIDLYPILVSTNGQGVNTSGRETSTSPGPFIAPIKAENFDGYPASFRTVTGYGETILGVVSAAGRAFLLTPNTLQALTPTGLPSAPFTCRPFWKRGFSNPYNVAFIDDTLYGFTTAGMFRSIATGDEGSESHTFAADVESLTADWHGGYVFVAHDPKNEEVCFFYSASRQNEQGYWETDIFPYSLRQQSWQPPVILSDSTRDMIVSGVATVNGHLEFLAGGRRASTSNRVDTFRYDSSDGTEAVPWYLAWNMMDSGVEMMAKALRKLRPKGRFTDCTVQLYVTTPDSTVDIADLETGANPTYEYTLTNSTIVKQYGVQKCRVRNAMMWTARIEGTSTWSGDPDDLKDSFHELAVELDEFGQLR